MNVAFTLVMALTSAATAQFCAVYGQSTASTSLSFINTTTGKPCGKAAALGPFTFDDSASIDAAGRFFTTNTTSLSTSTLGNVESVTVRVLPPAGYSGPFGVSFVNADPVGGQPIAVLMSATWAVIANIDPHTGATTVRATFDSQMFTFKAGLSAFDSVSSLFYLVFVGSDSVTDVCVSFALDSPSLGVAPTILPFPQGSVAASLRFAGPFFSGPGLLALVRNPNGGGLSLLGSFLNQGGQADFFEILDYDDSVTEVGAMGQLAVSADERLAFVGLRDKSGASVVSTVNTQTNQEVGRLTAHGFTVFALANCTAP
jgi:hypothetical protein